MLRDKNVRLAAGLCIVAAMATQVAVAQAPAGNAKAAPPAAPPKLIAAPIQAEDAKRVEPTDRKPSQEPAWRANFLLEIEKLQAEAVKREFETKAGRGQPQGAQPGAPAMGAPRAVTPVGLPPAMFPGMPAGMPAGMPTGPGAAMQAQRTPAMSATEAAALKAAAENATEHTVVSVVAFQGKAAADVADIGGTVSTVRVGDRLGRWVVRSISATDGVEVERMSEGRAITRKLPPRTTAVAQAAAAPAVPMGLTPAPQMPALRPVDSARPATQ